MSSDEIRRLMRLFAGHGRAHGTHGEPTQVPGSLKWQIKTTAQTLREPVTEELWEQHLNGTRPLGVIPINEESLCQWGSIDYDIYDDDMLAVIDRIQRSALPLVPCRSKSGGLHLFIFFRKPQAAALLIPALRDMAAHLGLMVRPDKTDIFPAQQQILTERGDLGNWIIMPYYGVNGPPGIGTFGGRIHEQYGVKKTGAEMTLGEFIRAAEQNVLDAIPPPMAPTKARPAGNNRPPPDRYVPPAEDFSDGPPCLQHLVSHDILDDGRKRTLFHAGIYHKKRGEGWQVAVDASNQKYMKPPLPSEEVLGVIRSLEKKDYEYTCKEEPMRSHCDATVCRFRKYGVGDPGEIPRITSLSFLDTDPPIWFVSVEGAPQNLQLTTAELKTYNHFHTAAFDQLKILYTMVKQADWVEQVRLALENVQPIPAPIEISTVGQIIEWLQDFCTDRAGSTRREDILRGAAWLDEERQRYWFQIKDFVNFLKRERVDVRGLSRGQIITYIRDKLHGGNSQMMIKPHVNRGCWWVPAGAFDPPPEPDAPPKKEEPI